MTLTRRPQADEHAVPPPPTSPSRLGSWWAIVGLALVLLLALGWRFIADPSLSAPTRDPAWYTWRAGVILEDDPGSVAGDWGPDNLFSGGYRVTVPLAGALLQRVAGISTYSFSAFLMLGIPILTGLALGVGAFRSKRDPLVVLLTMLATAGLFLTTPYVGYLDNITVLFLLCLIVAFADAARTSWGARVAIFMVGFAAAFTHPTTCVLFGVSLMGVWATHLVTSRFRLGSAMRSDGPLMLSTGFGMVTGLALWVVGIWGPGGPELLKDAALPPPYTAEFFRNRLVEWVTSMQPLITFPLILLAIISTVLIARRTRTPVAQYEQVSIWWMFPFAGVLTFLLGQAIPSYRFMNATAAPMALTGLGAFVAVRWLVHGEGARRIAGVLGAFVVVGALVYVFVDPAMNRWAQQDNQWAPQSVRTSLAAAREVAGSAREHPIVLIVNYGSTDDETGSNTTYGWAKTFTNVFRTGLPGDVAKYQVTYVGRVEDFRRGVASDGPSENYRDTTRSHWNEVRRRLTTYPESPVVFLIGEYYAGRCNGVPECTADDEEAAFERATDDAIEIGPGTYVLTGDGYYEPSSTVVERARAAAEAAAGRFADPPGPLDDLPHQTRVLAGLFLLAVLPGLLAAPFFGLKDTPSRIALIPGTSIVMSLLAGIAVLGVWRGPLTPAKAWVVVAVAVGAGAALRFGETTILRALGAFGGFFNRLFSQFSNHDFATLLSVQFLTQAGQGVVQGAIGKSIAFGGQKGFDVQNVPSADYLLQVILLLYVPYTLLSPFIGVVIDRFERRRVVWWSNLITASVVAIVAVAVLLPLGAGSTEGDIGATAALIVGLLAAQAVIRVTLAVKSAAIPDVLSGRDLLQGNALSQAGGALFQIVGIAFALGSGAVLPAWLVVLVGAIVLGIGAVVATRLRHVEAEPHATTLAQEARRVIKSITHGIREVAARPAAALGVTGFQMLRYQFWGFGLFVFALYAKNLVEGGAESQVPTLLSGGVGLIGGVLGLVLAQAWKDRVPPVRLLLVSMVLLGAGTLVFGGLVSVAGFAGMLFVGFFAFFVGKISADTIVQQAMPDDFRGRAFALFDIAYNLGFIVPALILSLVWIENDPGRTRVILMASGAVFLLLTAAIAAWARRIRDQFAPQDDLIEA
ncbi:MAG TPA: MFS transporter [Actinomycetota bacterium]|nr:MFS transporter [Actinomycetota bacterium]